VKSPFIIISIVYLGQMISAVLCAPHSCEWGLNAYFLTGVVCFIIALILPNIQKDWSLIKKLSFSIVFPISSLTLWIFAFFMENFRIMCHLF
jgi:hypothetical protein